MILEIFNNTDESTIFITPVIYSEFLKEVPNKEYLPKYLKFLKRFKMVYANEESEKIFIIFEKYSLSHLPSIPDAKIAAIALHYDAKIFTLNTKDFLFMEGLSLI